ncbi:hypothetical protein [Aureliella helgolandensis]|uniref:Uncharacterized protein n=1 Tax=Aureliella helgolandensis TaxID=2527968 RepID=A0A518G448_9BACT|nr:hypothetical protein [Aureliella helgolandensis]QDV23376.1 hypothetical protein Q31a_16740 [Aureliella helgolandensis]
MTANFTVRTIATLSLLICCAQSPLSIPICADELIDRQVEADVDSFASCNWPAVVQHYHECHSTAPTIHGAGLQADDLDAIRWAGDSGPPFEPGNSKYGLLSESLEHDPLKMQADKSTTLTPRFCAFRESPTNDSSTYYDEGRAFRLTDVDCRVLDSIFA